ncbi:MAG: hypothetical protein HOG08_02205, partial [Candidatus Magasanikbacteria bacterium]|nr:hypothetical protein [Candidatus Magasanikbacteria bacterium]
MEPMPIERLILDKKIEEKKIVPGGEERLKSLVEFSEENKEGTKAFMKSLFFLIKKGIILRVKGQEHIDDYDSNNIQEYSGNYNKEDIKATLVIHDISEI